MKKLTAALLFFSLFLAGTLHAQTITVSGHVLDDATSEPLIGATVMIQGTSLGTITDLDGYFKLLDIAIGQKVVISYTGMASQQISIKQGQEELLIRLKEDTQVLNDIVVTGYGTARKRDLTGAIVSVAGNDVKTAPNGNVMSSLQGKVPGLFITSGGSAGNTPDVKIRGISTVNAGTQPLYIVDGLFVGDINFLSPNDIENIEVLKDPSSLATFGVQGANGVIIITTKQGKKGRVTINYDGYAGVQSVFRRDRVQLTNADEFTMLYNEQLANQNPQSSSWVPDMLGEGTDWQSKVLRSAAITSHNLTVSNANEKGNYILGLGYFFQDGVMKYNNYQRFNVRFAGDYQVGKHIKIGGNVNLSRVDNTPATANIQQAVQALPTYMPYADAKAYNPEDIGSKYNPVPDLQNNRQNPVLTMEVQRGMTRDQSYRVVGNVFTEITFLKDFVFRAAGYGDLGFYRRDYKTPIYNQTTNQVNKQKVSKYQRNCENAYTWQTDITLTYHKKIGNEHDVTAIIGYTAQKKQVESFGASADSIANNQAIIPESLWMLSQGNPNTMRNWDSWSAEAFMSCLARVQYTLYNRYNLTATFRADGSSKFSPKKRWGYFPSVGLGWIMSEEKWMAGASSWLDFLKLRASWGMLGNDKIRNYLYFPTINPTGNQVLLNGQYVYIPTTDYEVDENIHWEVVDGWDVGVIGHFFKSRLQTEIGYYIKTTKDLLAYVPISSALGNSTKITNAGSVRNQGVEFSLGWDDKIGDFTYGANINGATLKNRVIALGNDDSPIYGSANGNYANSHITRVGDAIGSFYGYTQDGIFQTEDEVKNYVNSKGEMLQPTAHAGDIRFKDINGDGIINGNDRDVIGSPLPSFTYGFGVHFGWKGLLLSVDFNGVYGNKILDLKKTIADVPVNFYDKDLGRWHGEGTSNKEPILDKTRGANYMMSSNLLEDGSYVRLKEAQISYTLPQKLMKPWISSVRFYLQGQNLVTWKNNTGFTPEVGGGILNGGVDQGNTYPIPATFSFGVNLQF